jgi:hypothetical protein
LAGITALTAGPWFIRNHLLYGDWTALELGNGPARTTGLLASAGEFITAKNFNVPAGNQDDLGLGRAHRHPVTAVIGQVYFPSKTFDISVEP